MLSVNDTPWRAAYEAYSACAWFGIAAGALWLISHTQAASDVVSLVWCASAALAFIRITQALHVWRGRAALEGRSIQWISTEELQAKMRARPGHLWLGYGFDWTAEHAQRLYDLQKLKVQRLRVPGLAVWRALKGQKELKGSALLHAVEPTDRDVYVPLEHLNGHCFVAATTGALKTRLLALMAAQAIRRQPRECVVVVDPKGDRELLNLIKAEAVAAGRGSDFAYFHPAFPKESIRLDLLANFTRPTEVASRIAAIMPREKGNDPWSAFGWRVLHLVEAGSIATHGERPTLATLLRYVEGGVDELLRHALVHQLEQQGIDWRAAIEPYRRNLNRYKRPSPTTPDEVVALVAYYKSERQRPQSMGILDGLISMFEHDREHSQKMLASLIPVLTMLTAGDLAGLLSPDRDDPNDRRPILNGASIVESASIVYVGLDALSDSMIASAIASLFMADLTAHAGSRHNLGITKPQINLFDDEASASINLPFIELLNKGRSAGYRVFFFSQTFPDFVAKLGNEALARQVIGNANSIIAGRCKDAVTAEYVTEDFGRVVIHSTQAHHSTNVAVEGMPLNFTGSFGERHAETVSELVPADSLSKLPDLEYYASFAGSRIVKARIPLIRPSGLPKRSVLSRVKRVWRPAWTESTAGLAGKGGPSGGSSHHGAGGMAA